MSRGLDDVFDGMWETFEDAGFFETATVLPATGEPYDISVDFRHETLEVLDGAAQSAQPTALHRVVDADLRKGTLLRIDGVTYRLRRDPEPDQTGLNATCWLEKMP